MDATELQAELAAAKAVLATMVARVNRHHADYIEHRASAAQAPDLAAVGRALSASATSKQHRDIAMADMNRQSRIVQGLHDSIADDREIRESHLELFSAPRRVTAQVVPFPAANTSPEAA